MGKRSTGSSSPYVVWTVAPTPGVQLRERGLRGFWLEQETLLGDWKRARNWPKGVRWSLERRVHRGAMPDNLPNKDGLVIVSPRLKAFLQRAKITNVEYLPISISDAPYFIVHPLRAQSAFDWKRSQFDQRAQRVTAVRKLVLDDATIRRPGSFFRVSSVESLVFLPRTLASAIAAAALMNKRLGLRELLDEGAIDGDLGQARDKTLKALARA